jgi:hypothetical protein
LKSIANLAAFYDVPYEHFAVAARESVGTAAIEEAALRLAMRCGRELHDLEKLFPDDGRTEAPPPLVEPVRELLDLESPAYRNAEALTPEGYAALFKEILADTAAGKREDAHWYGGESQEQPGEKTVENAKNRSIER